MPWRQFVMPLAALDMATVEALFLEFGAASVTLTDGGDQPVLEPAPGETPLWPETCITGLFDATFDGEAFAAFLCKRLQLEALPEYRVEDLGDRDWEREWLKDFQPMRFGERLVVAPTNSVLEENDDIVVRLDPGLAFGTGSHATTALCLGWLDEIELVGKTVLDYGCGSGILAIAALKLGCERAVAMDIDPQAVIATRQNAAANGVDGSLDVFFRPDSISGKFDRIVANILAEPLVNFAESITSRLVDGGMLALSGVLCEQAREVKAAYSRWITFDPPQYRQQDGQQWARLTGTRIVN